MKENKPKLNEKKKRAAALLRRNSAGYYSMNSYKYKFLCLDII